MSEANEFSFSRFIDDRKAGVFGREDGPRYAYSADVSMRRGFQYVRPVELAAAAVVRSNMEFLRGSLLGHAVKVGPQQFPSIYKLASGCAEKLGVPVPQIYVTNSPIMNAYTFGTETDSCIVLHSALVDHFTDKELEFVIGHETGHVQNKHVVYGTALILLQRLAEAFLGPLIMPAVLALSAWYRRAEITCDRAGLLCSQDLDAGARSFVKLAVGSKRLAEEFNIEAYLAQHDENTALGRMSEYLASHPHLPKRILALRTFADSEFYRSATKTGEGGLSMEEVDERTSRILRISKDDASGEERPADEVSNQDSEPEPKKGAGGSEER